MNTIVITGATSGIGLANARLLAEKGYRVLGVGRSQAHCDAAKQTILQENPAAEIHYFTADLMQQSEVNRVAEALSGFLQDDCEGKLYTLINNAGCARSWYTTTEDGFEQLFALNVLASFLLTHRLLPYLQSANGRVIMTGSNSHKGIKVHWEDVMLKKRYNPLTAYKQSKLCDMLFAQGLNDRFRLAGIRAYVVDPGLVHTEIGNKQTGGLVRLIWNLRKRHGVPPEVPAKTYAYLCDAKTHPAGLCYLLCKEIPYSRQVGSENADRLFSLCERLCGVKYT